MLADAENQRLMLEGMTSRPLSIELPEQIFWNLIQDQLKPGEIAVELMENPDESGPAYAAVVLSSVDVPKAVLLESAELQELAATAVEERALQPETRTRAARLLWGPILETTEETVLRIYVNPEGLYEEAIGPDYAEWTGAEIVPLASTRELMDR